MRAHTHTHTHTHTELPFLLSLSLSLCPSLALTCTHTLSCTQYKCWQNNERKPAYENSRTFSVFWCIVVYLIWFPLSCSFFLLLFFQKKKKIVAVNWLCILVFSQEFDLVSKICHRSQISDFTLKASVHMDHVHFVSRNPAVLACT